MLMTFDDVLACRDDILRLAEIHGATNVRVFGSFVRDEANQQSDLDLLVSMCPDRSLLDRVALMQDLEDSLGRKVDIVNENAIPDVLRTKIVQEAKPL